MNGPLVLLEEYRCTCGIKVRLLGRVMSGFAAMEFWHHCPQDERRPLPPLVDVLEQHEDFWLSQTGRWELNRPTGHPVARFRELAEAERFRREVLKDPDGATFTIREPEQS
jgi:hypothetical protein